MRKIFIWLAAPALMLSVAACEVRKTEEGEIPEVDVKGGKMPKYDVKSPDIEVRKKKVEITVPDVKIIKPDRNREPAAGTTRIDGGEPVMTRMAPTMTATPKMTTRK